MGKGELWDDSALIHAFDNAISTYKKMHVKGYKDVQRCTEDSSVVVDDKSHVEAVDGGGSTVEVGGVEISETYKTNEVADSQIPEEHAPDSNNLPIHNENHQTQSPLNVDEYNELYKQYYELEEQRQNILQRMQKINGWTYQDAGDASVSGLQWSSDSATMGYQPSTSQAPCGSMVVSCCSCTCPYAIPSCTSPDACGGSLSTGSAATRVSEKLSEDVDIVKMTIEAAEKAIASLKDKTSDKEDDSKICSGMKGNGSSETDLGTLLNSWFSAGFQTGKYLAKQSIAKEQPE